MLDDDALDDLFQALGDDPDRVAEVIDRFLDDAPRWWRRIATGLDRGDQDGALDAATSLAEAGARLGAVDLADHAARLEHAIRRHDPMTAALLEDTGSALGSVEERLREQRALGWPKR